MEKDKGILTKENIGTGLEAIGLVGGIIGLLNLSLLETAGSVVVFEAGRLIKGNAKK